MFTFIKQAFTKLIITYYVLVLSVGCTKEQLINNKIIRVKFKKYRTAVMFELLLMKINACGTTKYYGDYSEVSVIL